MVPQYHLCCMYGHMWSPGDHPWRRCGNPGAAYGAYVVARIPRMALLWSPGCHTWRSCGRPGAVYVAYMALMWLIGYNMWHGHAAYMARTWHIRGVWVPQTI